MIISKINTSEKPNNIFADNHSCLHIGCCQFSDDTEADISDFGLNKSERFICGSILLCRNLTKILMFLLLGTHFEQFM